MMEAISCPMILLFLFGFWLSGFQSRNPHVIAWYPCRSHAYPYDFSGLNRTSHYRGAACLTQSDWRLPCGLFGLFQFVELHWIPPEDAPSTMICQRLQFESGGWEILS